MVKWRRRHKARRSGMEASFMPQGRRGGMDEEEDLESMSSSLCGEEGDSDEESREDATSSSSSCSFSPPSCTPSSDDQVEEGPLFEMSSLISLLPVKRGLSKHFEGKSQSFTSLDKARCLGDLAKPGRPSKRRLGSCKSYGGGLNSHKPALSPMSSSRIITKKASSLLSARRHRDRTASQDRHFCS
ncbi:hypothetical protein C4D60_Mb11t01360 [Musa balbisiana]|uniref:Uncharacterized protein n=1 Tax=Musa balbisiana TaxID=52838 RepID=A0A4S8J0Z9_MUSBA|nr:hypothetical protein C4D60_Mb11t01360 [Musa balbisiana]